MNMKKIALVLAALLVGATMTACSMANGGSTGAAIPSPSALATALIPGQNRLTPESTDSMGMQTPDNAAMTAAMTTAESAALSKKANDAAAQVSEIDGCVTAIVGNTCLAGVTFDKQYQGEMTDRIRDMVASRIQSVAPSVERVAVTHDPALVAQIEDVANQIGTARNMGEVTERFDSVMEKMQ